ncbi:YkvA family protein [Chakrabartyella piscis]|uniref:YkvA family protein n=1 Tax=Chakrabartyella piscis TaxID=2918914 RepID=UPI002958B5AE|nr:DUF1232 domain-containing protein [Chakrabartyella piscis]
MKNQTFSKQQLLAVLEANDKEAEKILKNEEKFERLIARLEEKIKMVPVLGEYLSELVCLVALVRSYIKKEYTDIPLGTIIMIISAILYIVSPVDLIPDSIPGIGYLDDVAVLALVLKGIHSDVEEFKAWRVANGEVEL